MATQLQLRRGNTAQTAVFTGAVGEVTVDTDQKTLTVHDNVTVGGNYIINKTQFDANLSIIQGINTSQNNTITAVNQFTQSAFTTANGANGLAAGAFNQANTNSGAIVIIQGTDLTQNVRLGSIETVNQDQNTAISIIQGVNLGQNTTITAVNNFAQAAYNTANGKFSSSGGTISGDVAVTGNLTVTGETFYANVKNINVDDSFITLNANTVGAPVFNAGIEVDRGTANNVLLYWNEFSKTWDYTDDLLNDEAIASQTYVGTSITPVNQFAQSAYDQANSANSLAGTAYTTALGANGLAAGAFNLANTSLQNSGTQTLNGNLIVNGSINSTEWSNTSNAYVSNKLYAGIAPQLSTPLPDLIAQFTGNTNNYVQVNAENIDPEGSADFVITADVGDDSKFYLDLGLHNSNREFGVTYPLDGYLLIQGNTGQIGGNLIIGTTSQTPGQHTKIVAGGGEESNVVIQFNDDLSTIFYGNAIPSVTNSQYLGSSTKRWHSVYVGPGSVDIDNIVLSNNNGQLVITGASDFVISGSSVPSTGDISNKANNAYDRANAAFASSNAVNQFASSAFNTANGANGLAAGAYAQANTNAGAIAIIQGVDLTQNTTITAVNNFTQSAFNTANGANGLAAGAYAQANTNAGAIAIIQGVDLTQNTTITAVNNFASSAFNTANGANGLAAGAFAAANTNASNISIIQGVDLTQNTNITAVNNYAASAYNQANTNSSNITAVNGFAQSAFNTANGANGLANGAFTQANSAYSYTTQVEVIALNAYNKANSAFDSSNAVNGFAISAFNKANSANILAQSAFDTANLKFNTSGGNINGGVVITANNDLTVTGNLYVLGNTTSFGTQTLEVVDPMILLANGNFYSDLVDIGFSGSYNDGANAHTGLFRESTVKEWYFFEGYTPEVSGNNNINIADASFRKANVNANYVKGNLIATTAVVGDRNILSYTQAAFDTANTANTRAFNSVAKSGDTMTGSLTGVTTLGATTISLAQVDATSNTFLTSSTSQVSVDAWPTASYRSAKYFVQVSSGTDFHIIELNLVHNGTTVFLAQYGEVLTSSSLGTFDADISGSTVRLLFTGVNSVSTVKVLRTVVDV